MAKSVHICSFNGRIAVFEEIGKHIGQTRKRGAKRLCTTESVVAAYAWRPFATGLCKRMVHTDQEGSCVCISLDALVEGCPHIGSVEDTMYSNCVLVPC